MMGGSGLFQMGSLEYCRMVSGPLQSPFLIPIVLTGPPNLDSSHDHPSSPLGVRARSKRWHLRQRRVQQPDGQVYIVDALELGAKDLATSRDFDLDPRSLRDVTRTEVEPPFNDLDLYVLEVRGVVAVEHTIPATEPRLPHLRSKPVRSNLPMQSPEPADSKADDDR